MGIDRWRVRELFPVDLSPKALEERFRDLAQLDELVRSLRTARIVPRGNSGARLPVHGDAPREASQPADEGDPG